MGQVTAKQLMTKDVITLAPDVSAKEGWKRLVQHRVSGAPVVDGAGKLVGVISINDLARAAFMDKFDPSKARSFYEALSFDEGGHVFTDESPDLPSTCLIREIMNPYVITVPPNATAKEVAKVMREQRIHRVIVLDDDEPKRVVGIISALDVLALIAD